MMTLILFDVTSLFIHFIVYRNGCQSLSMDFKIIGLLIYILLEFCSLLKTLLWLKCRTAIKVLFLYLKLCLCVMLNSLSCSFTSIFFLLIAGKYIKCKNIPERRLPGRCGQIWTRIVDYSQTFWAIRRVSSTINY